MLSGSVGKPMIRQQRRVDGNGKFVRNSFAVR